MKFVLETRSGFRVAAVPSLVVVAALLASCVTDTPIPTPTPPSALTTRLLVDPPQIVFHEAPVGDVSTVSVAITNVNTVPLRISVTPSQPFQATLDETFLAPGTSSTALVTFRPTEIGSPSGELTLSTDSPGLPSVTVPIQARAIALPTVDLLREGVPLEIVSDGYWVFPQEKEHHYTVVIPPVGPGKTAARLVLALDGDLPQGATYSFQPAEVPLGLSQLSHLSLTIPQVPRDAPPVTTSFRVTANVLVNGTRLTTVQSEPMPLVLFFQESGDCICPEGAPAPTLIPLDSREVAYPDFIPPSGKTSKTSPVATVNAKIEGPQKGQCCAKGAQFRLTLSVSNEATGHSTWPAGVDGTTALFLVNGFCSGDLTAKTKGISHPITATIRPVGGTETPILCPEPGQLGNVPINLGMGGHIVRFASQYDVPIVCNGGAWSCSVAEKNFVTTFDLANEGKVEAHWEVDVGGVQCVLDKATAKITGLVFLRGDLVYDPINDEFVHQDADKDSDGTKNYSEVLKRTNPQDPTSK